VRYTEDLVTRASELHHDAIVIAGHTDICPDVGKRQRAGERGVFAARHAPVLRSGGITAVCDHVAGDARYHIDFPFRNIQGTNRLKFAVQAIDAMYRDAEASPETMLVVMTADDIVRAKREGKIAVVLCLEGASPIEGDLNLLGVYYRLGVRKMGLTHDHRNLLADGVRSGADGGLTTFGKDAVREMHRLGMIVDVSHIAPKGFWDAIEVGGGPVHASHSNCAALCDHPRNLTDDMLRAVAKSGGVVGAHALGPLITKSGRPEFEQLLDHIEHMVAVMGEDHVSIGPDLMENYPKEEYDLLWQGTPKLHYVYPPEFDSYAKFPNITAGLLHREWPEAKIRKLLGENLLRSFRTVWKPVGTAA